MTDKETKGFGYIYTESPSCNVKFKINTKKLGMLIESEINASRIRLGFSSISDMLKRIDMADVVCFHHNDLDGKMAAHLLYEMGAKWFFECDYNSKDIEHYSLIVSVLEKVSAIVIVDYSLDTKSFEDVIKLAKEKDVPIIWMDHHQTSFELVKYIQDNHFELVKDSKLIVDLNNTRCGAAIVYDNLSAYIHRSMGLYKDCKVKQLKHVIDLVDDYDRWIKAYEQSDYLNIYLYNSNKMYPGDVIMHDVLIDTKTFDEAMDYGKQLFEIQALRSEVLYNAFSYETEIQGHKARVLLGYGNSTVFGEHIKEYDIVVILHHRNGKWDFSIYTDKADIDCSEICKQYDGGGHRKAAGGRSDERPF